MSQVQTPGACADACTGGGRTVLEERCSQCGAGVRPHAPWCTQCFAPGGAAREDRPGGEVHRRPVPAPVDPTPPAPGRPVDGLPVAQPAVRAPSVPAPSVPAPSVPAPSVPAPSVPAPSVPAPSVPAPLPPVLRLPAASDEASWPCGACGGCTPLSETVCGACGTAFLAGARGAPPALVLPVVGDVTAMSPVRLAGVAMTLLTALLLAGLIGGALVG